MPDVDRWPVSGSTCLPGSYVVSAALTNTSGPFNVWSVTCSNGVTTLIARPK